MSRRYLFGPLSSGFANDYLLGPRQAGQSLAFDPAGVTDLAIGWNDSWESIKARLPAGWKPDFIVLHLAYNTIPPCLWTAPVPLIAWAADSNLLYHVFRHQLRRCELVLADTTRTDLVVFWALALIGVGLAVYCVLHQESLLATYQWPLLVIWIGVWAGLLYVLRLRRLYQPLGNRPILSAEAVILGAMAFASLAMTTAIGLRGATTPTARVAWTFLAPDEGWIASSPLVVGDRVFVAVAHHKAHAFYGALYCLDRQTGERLWTFNDDGGMKPVYSSPCVSDGRLYIGEGFHQDSLCKLYCLDAATGKKLWDFQTKSHTESTPCVASGKVFFGAGDDGLYCLDARSGRLLWHFEGLHVDASPAVVGDRVYAGSGYGNYEVFCLAADTGKPLWRTPVELPAFGSPTVAGDHVFFGIGNGNLLTSAGTPAGALLCLETQTGKQVWQYAVSDAVHTKPVVTADDVYFTSRDHHCYCLDQTSGRLRWKRDLGSPIVTAPRLTGKSPDGSKSRLYVIDSGGSLWCLDSRTGLPRWTYDVTQHTPAHGPFLSSPAVVIDPSAQEKRWRLYFGARLGPLVSRPALYCLDEPFDELRLPLLPEGVPVLSEAP